MKRLLICGCSGLSRDIVPLIEKNDCFVKHYNKEKKSTEIISFDEILFIDSNFKKNKYLGYEVHKDFQNDKKYNNYFFVSFSSIKSQYYRKICRNKFLSFGFKEISLISKKAYIADNSLIYNGCFIGNGVYLGPNSIVETGTIILFNSVVSRDCFINNDVFISANVTVTAGKKINNNAYIGAGSLIDASIGELSVIGSGSSIKRDVKKFTFFDGATNIKYREVKFELQKKFIDARSLF
tara:strand:+ start:2261 stop:2974 length:714 start_codon:yes stop_codon:yes gene_type:complete